MLLSTLTVASARGEKALRRTSAKQRDATRWRPATAMHVVSFKMVSASRKVKTW